MSDWEITPGRCGACTKFIRDYGSGPKTYGHCGVKPRAGSITAVMYKCDVYVPRAEVAPAPAAAPPQVSRPRSLQDPFEATAATIRPSPSSSAARAATRPAASGGSRGQAPEPLRRVRSSFRDREPVELLGTEDTLNRGELRDLLREAIDDALGLGELEPLDRFKGGTVVVRPGTPGTQDKEIPIDVLLHKLVMIRDSLRVLEQKIGSHPSLDDADRVSLQHYVTRCYGSLTTFNGLFKHREDWFKGSGKD